MKFARVACAVALGIALDVTAVPVVFQVDLGPLISMGNVNVSNTVVEARGSFQDPVWSSGFTLTNSPLSPNIFTGTYDIQGFADTRYTYKFLYNNPDCPGDQWESLPDRTFVLAAGGQTLPVTFFNNISTTPQSRDVSFAVDMAVPILKGTFDPGSGTVEVQGTFQSPCTWVTGFMLTNSPTQSTLFTGSYTVRNVASGQAATYKFVANGGQWESIPNRSFLMPATSTNLPVTPFNNEMASNVLVTFSVDLSAQILAGLFEPATGVVEVRGGFQNPAWSPGFVLTNNPSGANANVYSGAYAVSQTPGTRITYKFYASGVEWEQPASTGGQDRGFILSFAPQVLPTVFFSDLAVGDLLPQDTTVTFQVNMDNATAIAWNGNPSRSFDTATDSVYLNGDFLGWWGWNPASPPQEYRLTNAPGSRVYSITLPVAKNRSLALSYKYSINGGDNEAPDAQNHFRYIRQSGFYTMPIDVFGAQLAEVSSGELTIKQASAGTVLIQWLGRPGIALENADSLSGPWTSVSGTAGQNSTIQSADNKQRFYRLRM